MPDLILPATVIGSWSFPGWFEKFAADVKEHPERFGPADRDEAVRDAVRLAIDDQLRAGLDRITDGEMQRVDFNLGFYEYLHGIEPLPRARLLGGAGPRSARQVQSRRHALGARRAGDRRRVPPAARIHDRPDQDAGPGAVHAFGLHRLRQRSTTAARPSPTALVPIVNAELKALVAAGVDFIQLDEPSFACHPGEPEFFLETLARTVEGVNAYISMHLCFGNYRARAVGHRSYAALMPHLARARVNQLALEFASREMAEIELLESIPETMDVAVGLVDVKNTWIEPPELIAERLWTRLSPRRRPPRFGHARLRLLADGPARGGRQGEGDGRRASGWFVKSSKP